PGVQRLAIDQEALPLLDAVLLATDLDHCIHAVRLHTKMPAAWTGRKILADRPHSPSSRPRIPLFRFVAASPTPSAVAGAGSIGTGPGSTGGAGSPLAAAGAGSSGVALGFRARGLRAGLGRAASAGPPPSTAGPVVGGPSRS